jgi:hypothetical protein
VDEDQVASLLDTLEQGLNQAGLSALVNQERISAVEGRAEELSDEDEEMLRLEWSRPVLGRKPRVRADDVRTRPLNVGERLATLLDLLEAAVGGSYAIEVRLRDDLKTSLDADGNAWSGQVVFADPPESELILTSRWEWTLPDQLTLQNRARAVREVILLIDQLRGQANLTRSEQLNAPAAPSSAGGADLDIPGEWP